MQGSWVWFPVQPYIFILLFFWYIYVHSSPPYYIGAGAFPVEAFVFNKSWQGELVVFVVCAFEREDLVRGEESQW